MNFTSLKGLWNRIMGFNKITALFFALLIFVYVIYPVPIYWKYDSILLRALFFVYAVFLAGLFHSLFPKARKRQKKRLIGKLNRTYLLLLILIVALLPIKVFSIYYNPILLSNDEDFHIHRGEAFLFYTAEKIGFLKGGFGISDYKLDLTLNRFEPLPATFSGISYLFFGSANALPYLGQGFSAFASHFYLDELAVRFPSLVYTVLTFLLLFKITSMYYGRRTALMASISLFFFPSYFLLTSTAYLEAGMVFFAVLIAYFAVRYLDTSDRRYLLLTAFATVAGGFFKRPLLIFIIIVPLCIFLFGKGRFREKARNILVFTLLTILSLGPYYLQYVFFEGPDPYEFFFPSLSKALAFFYILPLMVTIPVAVLGIIAVITRFNKNNLSRFSLVWMLAWYVLITAFWWAGGRVILPLLVPLVILYSDLVMSLAGKVSERFNLSKKNLQYSVIVLMTAFLAFQSFIVFMGSGDVRNYRYSDFYGTTIDFEGGYAVNNNKFPYREIAQYLTENMKEGQNVGTVSIGHAPAPDMFFGLPNIIQFYMRSYEGLVNRDYLAFVLPATEDSLKDFCKENNITFFVLPMVDGKAREYLSLSITEEDVRELREMEEMMKGSRYFKLEKEESFGENRLLVFSIIG